jgi:hypothetical protein
LHADDRFLSRSDSGTFHGSQASLKGNSTTVTANSHEGLEKKEITFVFIHLVDRVRHLVVPRLISLALAGVLAIMVVGALAGCNPLEITHASQNSGSAPAVLQCNQSITGHGVDVLNMKLTCQASGAAGGDTSFQLRYTIKNGNGQTRSFDATCVGTVVNGEGTCTQTYALVIPFDSGSATISGEFLPSHKALGPLPLSQNNS